MLESQLLSALYSKRKTLAEFNWDTLFAPTIYTFVSEYDIERLYNIATSIKYAGDIRKKEVGIKEILEPRGFRRMGAGTNRIVYTYLDNRDFLFKVAVDKTGMKNTPDEFKNQQYLRPFVTKCFEFHPSGVLGSFERVMPITNVEEFLSVWDDIFEVLLSMIGEFILEDIGTQFFMNWGIRKGFGPVLLDFPELFKLDGNKLFCTKPLVPGQKLPMCGGQIDYDNGFNYLVCQTCNKQYKASDISKAINDKMLILKGEVDMEVQLVRGNDVIVDSRNNGTDIIKPAPKKIQKRGKTIVATFESDKFKVPEEENSDVTAQIAEAMRGVDMNNPKQVAEAVARLAAQRVAAKHSDDPEAQSAIKNAAEPMSKAIEDAVTSPIPIDQPDEATTGVVNIKESLDVVEQSESVPPVITAIQGSENIPTVEQPDNDKNRVKPKMPKGCANLEDF